jgi:hypothetical protein
VPGVHEWCGRPWLGEEVVRVVRSIPSADTFANLNLTETANDNTLLRQHPHPHLLSPSAHALYQASETLALPGPNLALLPPLSPTTAGMSASSSSPRAYDLIIVGAGIAGT